MEKVGKDNGEGDGFAGKISFLDKISFINNRRCSFRQRIRKKIPGQKPRKEKDKVIINADSNKVLENDTDNQHLQEGIKKNP